MIEIPVSDRAVVVLTTLVLSPVPGIAPNVAVTPFGTTPVFQFVALPKLLDPAAFPVQVWEYARVVKAAKITTWRKYGNETGE
jgi:hypothetical protein